MTTITRSLTYPKLNRTISVTKFSHSSRHALSGDQRRQLRSQGLSRYSYRDSYVRCVLLANHTSRSPSVPLRFSRFTITVSFLPTLHC